MSLGPHMLAHGVVGVVYTLLLWGIGSLVVLITRAFAGRTLSDPE